MSDFTPARVGPQPDHSPAWRAPPIAPVASEAPLTPVEVLRLAELRRIPTPLPPPMQTELEALAAREHIPPPPLNPDEVKRLTELGTPRVLSPEETAELDDLSRRSDIPRPLVIPDGPPADPVAANVHQALGSILALIEALAAQVPTAHAMAAQIASVRAGLEPLHRLAHNLK